MATLSQVRTYGGVGAILTLLLPVPRVGWLLALAGFVLTLIAVKYVSDILKDHSILDSMVISIVAAIGGVVAGVVVMFVGVLNYFGADNLLSADYWASFDPASFTTGDWVGLLGSVLAGIVVIWALMTVSGIYFRRSFSRVGAALNVGLFGTAGLLFLIGAATTIVLVGFLLIPIAMILLAIAFFSIRENLPVPVQAPGANP